ncbi:hypothetical protein AH68_05220 [Bifidobacterium catenulatum PV20-2]|uniref:Uncharacterized protein n=1 Tax=Bifidobacterium catenulatum PV20-2 TaxID=1447716 RepID=A0A0A7I8A9_9BIFI|nr:hypothetical protein AH68_05220 [Bifidobacterium catenulatum PV20-2]
MTVRINWFPDPNLANTIFKCIPIKCTVDFPTVGGFRWLRATTSSGGDVYAQYELTGVNLPPAGAYHIHAVCYAQGTGALFRVYAGVGNGFTILYETGVADNQTKIIDADITIPAGTTQLLIRVIPPSTVGKFILIRDILLESKSTYDTAIGGGASGLLHGGHDAARIGASVGRVMPDEGHEPMHEPNLDHHLESKRVEAHHDRSERDGHELLGQRLCERHRRHHPDRRNECRHQQKPTYPLLDGHQQYRSGINVLSRQVRQSDRHRDRHALMLVRRVSGEQGCARQPPIFHRGYDAASLTLTGVVA